ncbi:MAG: multidrug MFS transporter [Legionellales bacterium RIFCSPHIGHO2_12_FULL_35_11]|nr:MAG: multidrug MFS transporter [Legionellales bacterium RIFCSPHIGHO2_12_FULL_35_11]
MIYFLKKYGKFATVLYDVLAIPIAWYFAYWLRDNMHFLPNELLEKNTITSLYALTFVQISCFYHFKVFRGFWRFASIDDIERILRSVVSAVILFIPIVYLFTLDRVPRSIFPLYAITLTTILCGGRLIVRQICDKKYHMLKDQDVGRVLIIGAGQACEGLLRALKLSSKYYPVGILDDNLRKHGLDIRGVPIVGSINEITKFTTKLEADLIFIAIASANATTMRRIVGYCEKSKLPFKTLPSNNSQELCRVDVNSLRTVSIEDLLGRAQVTIQWEKIRTNMAAKRVLVTGGGGSIGSELCRQIAKLQPDSLAIVDSSEYNLFLIESEFRAKFSDINIEVFLVNVTDEIAIENLFETYKPEIVYHAAAYKHVPMLENQVRVAVQNNITGTRIVAEASVAANVEKFILISTDKAVNPTNIMGTTKRIAEIYCQNLNQKVTTQFITVRFGNVLGSTGSVVPLFQSQLQNGGPLTVTHPDMQRYFMTIPEASQLILQAMANGNGGEIFVLDMGEPVKISYLAEQMIRLAGKEPGKDVKIKYTGLRPGEKLFEELFHDSEKLVETSHHKLFQAQFRKINWDELIESLLLIDKACNKNQTAELIILLKNLVPEFNPPIKKSAPNITIEAEHVN